MPPSLQDRGSHDTVLDVLRTSVAYARLTPVRGYPLCFDAGWFVEASPLISGLLCDDIQPLAVLPPGD